ncbi:hypothetical protein P692DRAFT_20819357 [Suillus brevipes Sb2]|nr:hypothetical protein P692DRAFT_20819357 [Suillus brevipes Sb2]
MFQPSHYQYLSPGIRDFRKPLLSVSPLCPMFSLCNSSNIDLCCFGHIDLNVTTPKHFLDGEPIDEVACGLVGSLHARHKFKLVDLPLKFIEMQLSLVCSELGSEKTLSLLALLGEADILTGQVLHSMSSFFRSAEAIEGRITILVISEMGLSDLHSKFTIIPYFQVSNGYQSVPYFGRIKGLRETKSGHIRLEVLLKVPASKLMALKVHDMAIGNELPFTHSRQTCAN